MATQIKLKKDIDSNSKNQQLFPEMKQEVEQTQEHQIPITKKNTLRQVEDEAQAHVKPIFGGVNDTAVKPRVPQPAAHGGAKPFHEGSVSPSPHRYFQ